MIKINNLIDYLLVKYKVKKINELPHIERKLIVTEFIYWHGVFKGEKQYTLYDRCGQKVQVTELKAEFVFDYGDGPVYRIGKEKADSNDDVLRALDTVTYHRAKDKMEILPITFPMDI